MSGTIHSDTADPNLTPILDMVFQLITFFMLVVNFKGAALDMSLQLPVLGSARPLDTEGNENLLYLNIDSDGRLKLYGEYKDLETYVAEEARVAARRQQGVQKDFQPGDDLPDRVVLRADRSTPFELLDNVFQTCQRNGYRKFSLNAMSR
jgi:biopolymer transport protein ExbD